MCINKFTKSDGFFNYPEPLVPLDIIRFFSVKGRLLAIKNFVKKLLILPPAFFFKSYCSLKCWICLGFSIFFLVTTLFCSQKARDFFIKRVLICAKDLADWVLWPFGALVYLSRLLLAAIIHPAIFPGALV